MKHILAEKYFDFSWFKAIFSNKKFDNKIGYDFEPGFPVATESHLNSISPHVYSVGTKADIKQITRWKCQMFHRTQTGAEILAISWRPCGSWCLAGDFLAE